MFVRFSIRLKLFGFPLVIDLGFILVVIILFASASRLWIGPNTSRLGAGFEGGLLLTLSIIIHELGHAFAARRYGMKPEIRLHFLGGLTSWDSNKDNGLKDRQHLWIVLAGPVAGFLVAALVYAVWKGTGWMPSYFLSMENTFGLMMYFNAIWGALNLLPMFPLDGGQALYYIIRSWKNLDADRIIFWVSVITVVGLAIPAIYYAQYWALFLLAWIGSVNFGRLNFHSEGKDKEKLAESSKLISAGRHKEALDKLRALIPELRTRATKVFAFETAAYSFAIRNDREGLKRFLGQFPQGPRFSLSLRYLAQVEEKGAEQAFPLLRSLYVANPSGYWSAHYLKELMLRTETALASRELKDHHQSDLFWRGARLAQVMLHRSKSFELASRFGIMLWDYRQEPEIAYNLACSFARMERKQNALLWLESAVQKGFVNSEHLLADADLEAIRDTAGYQELLSLAETKQKLQAESQPENEDEGQSDEGKAQENENQFE